MCSNQCLANARVNDCAYDEQIPVGPDGFYTIVVSRKEDRPRNAIRQCGIAWLPMVDDGDGAGDADVTVVQLRHMLGTSDFPNAIQPIDKPGDERKVMGEYYPQGRYMSTSAFEIRITLYATQALIPFRPGKEDRRAPDSSDLNGRVGQHPGSYRHR